MKLITTGRRRWLRGALCAGLALAGTVAVAQPAQAYRTLNAGNCTEVTWKSNPQVVVHLSEFWAGGGSNPDDFGAMYEATYDVRSQFNLVGKTSAQAYEANVGASISPFKAGDWFNDPVPTIHVGFTDDPTDTSGAAGATVVPPPDANCQYAEAHIVFENMNLHNWNFGTPSEVGDDYYMAGEGDPSGNTYFRTAYLHELLHSFGLDHTHGAYSFMNYNYFPWSGGGRSERDSVRPLPDDAMGLRHLYPGAGNRHDVAVLNTWFNPNAVYNGSAIQHGLCSPSLGTAFSTDIFRFSPGCGTGGPTGGSTTVCAGDRLYTRFAFANYSTDVADDIDIRAFFSTDDIFQLGTDVVSPTGRDTTVGAGGSALLERTWQIPAGLQTGTEYYVIIEVAGTTANGGAVEDWIPLRGKVTGC
jgi:hypothetical protein